MSLLQGRRLLVTGVINNHSIAFSTARRAQELGAEIILTGFGRARRMTERAAAKLDGQVDVLELDVERPQDVEAVRAELEERWGALDGLVHAIAYAPADALGGAFLETPKESALQAFSTSAFSLKSLAATLAPLLAASGSGSVVAFDFDASVAWPAYDWMGVAKAALESVSRYLARDLGSQGIRVNLVAAGPIETLAAGGIPGFSQLAGAWTEVAPLRWDPTDPSPVADAACFLLSELARGVTGEILHADGGYHAMGAPARA